ncbi:MAG: tetraacyldisaccharide 4'-kinase [Rhodobacteraceae bacterium]|nr:tetraacyldisaccharide 4'-kinase [Paracoccaceae bacterium]
MRKAPDFWWKQKTGWQALVLAVPSIIYSAVSGRRMLQPPKVRSELPVICVGNFVVGGVGKTPFCLMLAELMRAEGRRPGFLLRGYGGRETGPLRVDPKSHFVDQVGDEALLLACDAPTIMSKDRGAGAKLAAAQGDIDILIMDDGFQNPSLDRDLNIVLVDAQTGLGNGWAVPAGPLRANMKTQISKTNILILVNRGQAAAETVQTAAQKGIPILHASVVTKDNLALRDKPLVAFAGIGRPGKFFESLENDGLDVVQAEAYGDHHAFTAEDVSYLQAEAKRLQGTLVTTSKDHARLERSDIPECRVFAKDVQVFDIEMKIEERDRLIGYINEKIRTRSSSK